MSTVSNKLSLQISSEISLKDFSFSQLIIEVKRLFDSECAAFSRVGEILHS
jgi:hypothetical protein